ncbi:autophagy-related protein 27 [Lentinula raphanica]|uniref:Autophagy-related protein 27 n=1 Tax=Lentinula raphanica TaxID=153919 RepID=A0AA38P9U3_9AGAR|nr:autophagy-related protein 27 [Lentinula raphanica]KAJ3829099.1 autophagy-related protein 27 [Lentinula raphanica]KAJ3838988.1 autophagy-related protein 27 [Lentinula raphanica]KAJ3977633.1 autophagy-related protein 27 [Lentinula raphanica]
MILRHLSRLPTSILLLLISCYASTTEAAEGFDCIVNIGTTKFDLTSLNNEHKVTRSRSTPPTTMVDTLTFNICDDLTVQGDASELDRCPSGSRACFTKINQKQDQDDRVVAVIPVAQDDVLNPSFSKLSSPPGLSIIMHGQSYPVGSDNAVGQSFKVNLICNENASDPKFVSYDGSQVEVEWTNPAACGTEPSDDSSNDNEGGNDGDSEEQESVGSGIGWFFLVILLAFAAYFGLGAYHNYTTYGATGMDLIPHRDFWQEVPYMLSDVVSHLCSSARPRRSSNRGGYIAV